MITSFHIHLSLRLGLLFRKGSDILNGSWMRRELMNRTPWINWDLYGHVSSARHQFYEADFILIRQIPKHIQCSHEVSTPCFIKDVGIFTVTKFGCLALASPLVVAGTEFQTKVCWVWLCQNINQISQDSFKRNLGQWPVFMLIYNVQAWWNLSRQLSFSFDKSCTTKATVLEPTSLSDARTRWWIQTNKCTSVPGI